MSDLRGWAQNIAVEYAARDFDIDALRDDIMKLVDAATAEAIERCAKVADDYGRCAADAEDYTAAGGAKEIARCIRALKGAGQ